MSFDHTVHKRNKKGRISSKQPYKLVIENGIRMYHRGGEVYSADGTLMPAPIKVETSKTSKKAE